MNSILAFVATAIACRPAAGATQTESEPALPTFKPRWWHEAEKLDARPVAWSLRNRPQDWEWARRPYAIIHKPSEHTFWVGSGWGFYRLESADCSCTSNHGSFQRGQQTVFHRAFVRWRNTHGRPDIDHAQFAAHFVTPAVDAK